MNIPSEHTQEQIILDGMHKQLSLVMDPEIVDSLEMYLESPQHGDFRRLYDYALHIRRTFYGEKRVDQISHSFAMPATWWQHFKKENFPRWLLRRFPVRYTSETKTTDLTTTFEFPKAYRPGNHYLDKFIITQSLSTPGPYMSDFK